MTRLLTLDIETAPMTVRTFGLRDQNIGIDQIVEHGGILCFAAKWVGERGIIYRSAWGDGEKSMIREAGALLDEADGVIGWNSARFDTKWIQAQLARFGYKRIAPFVNVDLMRSARHYFSLPSYKLDYVARFLGVGRKVKTGGFSLWAEVMDGDEQARRLMRRYNIGDTRLTEEVFQRMLAGGWVKGLPNCAIEGDHSCPHCGSEKLQARGYTLSKTRRYRRWQCGSCGGWSQSVICEPGSASLKAVA